MSRPKDADSARTYDRIVAAARTVLEEEGGDRKLTLRSVAEQADVSLGTLVYYFPNKATLLEACLDKYYDALRELVLALIARAAQEEPTALLERAAREIYRFHCRERIVLSLRVETRLARGSLPVERQERVLEPLVGMGARALARATGRPEDELRFGIQSMTYLLTHFTLCSPEELAHVFGRPVEPKFIEDHLARVAVDLLT